MSIASFTFLRRMQRGGILCVGIIVEFESDNDGDKTPVIEFITTEGETIATKPIIYSDTDLNSVKSYKHMLNMHVTVLYCPDRPEDFILLSEEGEVNYTSPLLFLLFGFVSLSIGLYFLFSSTPNL